MTLHFPFIRPPRVSTRELYSLQPAGGGPRATGSRLPRPLVALGCLLAALFLVSCTPNLGGDNVGWGPVAVHFPDEAGDPVRVYVVSQMDGDLEDLGNRLGRDLEDDERRVKLRALEDFGSGTPRVVWTYPPLGGGQGLEGAFGVPAVSDELGLIFVSGVDGHLYAISTETGSDTGGWKRAVRNDPGQEPMPLISSPVLTEIVRTDTGPSTIVVIGSEDGNLYAYSAATGEELPWSPFATEGRIWSTPTIRNGIAYFGSQDQHVYAVDLRDGSQLWRFRTGAAVVADPLLFRGMVIVGSFDKKLYALDADDGEPEWTFESNNWFWAGPVTDGETIFAPSMDGNVYALDPSAPPAGEAKEAQWRHDMESPIVSTPALVPLGLVVATVDGTMRLLSAKPSDLDMGEVVSNLPGRQGSGIKAPVMVGAPPQPVPAGLETGNLSVIQRYALFVGGDDGVIRRISVTEGQDKEAVWCFDTSKHEPCN